MTASDSAPQPLQFKVGAPSKGSRLWWKNAGGTLEGVIAAVPPTEGMTEWEIKYRDLTRGAEWRECKFRPLHLKDALKEVDLIYAVFLDYNERDNIVEVPEKTKG